MSPTAIVGRYRRVVRSIKFIVGHRYLRVILTNPLVESATPTWFGPDRYDEDMEAPGHTDQWLAVTGDVLPVGAIYEWCVRPDCGAVVVFSGTVRDHADGRSDVTSLEYEAYTEAVVPVFQQIVDETRRRFDGAKRIAILHRTGELTLGESSVVVAVSSAHRPIAFEAARFAIDAVKESAPIWKKENWSGGSDWGTGAHDIVSPQSVTSTQSVGTKQ